MEKGHLWKIRRDRAELLQLEFRGRSPSPTAWTRVVLAGLVGREAIRKFRG